MSVLVLLFNRFNLFQPSDHVYCSAQSLDIDSPIPWASDNAIRHGNNSIVELNDIFGLDRPTNNTKGGQLGDHVNYMSIID